MALVHQLIVSSLLFGDLGFIEDLSLLAFSWNGHVDDSFCKVCSLSVLGNELVKPLFVVIIKSSRLLVSAGRGLCGHNWSARESFMALFVLDNDDDILSIGILTDIQELSCHIRREFSEHIKKL